MAENGSIILKGGQIVQRGELFPSDILFSDGVITLISENIAPEAHPEAEVVDITGCVVSYGLVDVHVHFREPGFSAKETIASGSAAAAKGGYTLVCPMPNLNPAPDAPETLQVQLDLIRSEQAKVDVRPFATITSGRKGGAVVDMAALKDKVAGFSDDGSGIQTADVMKEAMMQALREDVVISAHCEDMDQVPFGPESEWVQVARDAEMATEIGCRYHVCHVSTKESVEAIRKAKAAGARVSCETAPHYLTLTQADRNDEGRFRMNPPLREAADRDALIAGIQDGTVEVIATDHAPHTAEEKSRGYDKSLMGIVGLETAFPVMYTKLVKPGVISLGKLFELMCDNPRRIFGFGGALEPGQPADIAVFDLDGEYVIDSKDFVSMGHSTPFDGWKVQGRCVRTYKDGKLIYE
ncbi:MAG: dihydroorotase [Bacteroidales bacterium]|nr:dihydroorotase [Bacteroidales bacterium]